MVPQIYQKSRSHLEILGIRKVTRSKLHIKDQKILSTTEQNLLAQDLHILANKVCNCKCGFYIQSLLLALR